MAAANARGLERFGIDGPPIFDEAQRLIHATPPGATPRCPAAPSQDTP
jgi:hypothetical protein